MTGLRSKSKPGPNVAWMKGWLNAQGAGQTQVQTPGRAGAAGKALGVVSLSTPTSSHPLADPANAMALAARESEIDSGFNRLTEALQALAPKQFDADFAETAVTSFAGLGIKADPSWFDANWTRPLDMGALHAKATLRLFARMVEAGGDRARNLCRDGEPVETLIRQWGFHAVDITPCADGRLAGLLGQVLRVPLSVVTARRSYAGAMFPVAQSLTDWERVELRRWRVAEPNAAEEPTQYLKMGVYHFSSLDPTHEGCAAHGSCDATAVSALLTRLIEFKGAVEAKHDAGSTVALLMVGVDTDTDTIRVHVPDTNGKIAAERYVSSADLHGETAELARQAAKEAVREAVARCAGVDQDDAATEGMRWFCGYLLKNNIAQVEAVLRRYEGPHPEAGHGERLIVIGDSVDDVQLRNLAFQAQMGSVEEGAGDLAVGLHILGDRLGADGLAVPILVLKDFDPALPGDETAAKATALRMRDAVQARQGETTLQVEPALRDSTTGTIRFLSDDKIRADIAQQGRATA